MPLPFVIFTYQRFQIIIFSRSCFCSIKTSLFKIVLKVLTYVLFCNKISVSKETKERFEDGSHIIYVNGSYKNDDDPVGKLMHDFRCTSSIDMFYDELKNTVK